MKKPGCNKCAETTVQGKAYIDKETGLKRILGRLTCPVCKKNYNKTRRSKSFSSICMY